MTCFWTYSAICGGMGGAAYFIPYPGISQHFFFPQRSVQIYRISRHCQKRAMSWR
uniref:Uncharacterized protein n=1 Tax=Anguilla anguilla TaxID=7936 RepID=A0A0E9R0U1_ANGAN